MLQLVAPFWAHHGRKTDDFVPIDFWDKIEVSTIRKNNKLDYYCYITDKVDRLFEGVKPRFKHCRFMLILEIN